MAISHKIKFGFIALTLGCLSASLDAKVDAFFADEAAASPTPSPWFTGPLLTPSGHVVPAGHINIEPYVYAIFTDRVYGSNWKTHSLPHDILTINYPLPVQVGITKWMDIVFVPQGFYTRTHGVSSSEFGDLPFGVDLQLYKRPDCGWWPSTKLTISVNGPTGKFERGNPHKLGTDLVGKGSWNPSATLVFARLFHIECEHYLATRLAFGYTVATPVHIHGLSSYGGSVGTHGKVRGGNSLNVVLGMEYSLTQNWVLALDIQETHFYKSHFSGTAGTTAAGTPAVVGGPSSDQISLAPAIEYNWSSHVGIIGGAWFTVAGRNSQDFVSGVVALNIYL